MSRLVPGVLASCGLVLLVAGCATPAQDTKQSPVAAPSPAPAGAPSTAPAGTPSSAPVVSPAALEKAIPFSATSLSGDKIEFPQAYAGKLVLLSIWATWCPHCRREVQFWRDAYDKYHNEGLEIIGLVTDGSRGTQAEKVAEFVKQNQMTWPQVFDDAPRLSQLYGTRSVPWSFLIDADTGRVLAQKKEVRKEALAKVIEEQLAIKKARAVPGPAGSRATP